MGSTASSNSNSRQKKFDTRIDFTPMVDMNMLLITFFMLCTTMLKSQTLQITLPTNEKVEEKNQQQAKESEALTIIINGKVTKDAAGNDISVSDDAKFYYYDGQLLPDGSNLKETGWQGNVEETLRAIFQDRNKEAIKLINEQKALWEKGQLSDSLYQIKAREIRNNENLKRPVVMIKPSGSASYADVVKILDEMAINNISRYQLEVLTKEDTAALLKKGVQLPPVRTK